jgi:hypothetical protein
MRAGAFKCAKHLGMERLYTYPETKKEVIMMRAIQPLDVEIVNDSEISITGRWTHRLLSRPLPAP